MEAEVDEVIEVNYKQEKRYMYNVTLRCTHEPTVTRKGNNYYILVCVTVRMVYMHANVCVGARGHGYMQRCM